MLAHNKVARQFEAEPAAGHAGSDLEQIGDNAFVHTPDTFLGHDCSDGVPDGLVLVSHS